MKSILYNQNFFRDPRLVSKIIRLANFGPNDTVYEIGPGRGIITRELVKTVGKVIAVEVDQRLAGRLQVDFAGNDRVKIINADWLNFCVPEKEYKVFSNIPFNITAEVVRKLLNEPNLPAEVFLVVQKEAAQKFTGTPKETQFSVLNKPWFEFEIVRQFKKIDFMPIPGVETVLLKITKRGIASVDAKHKSDYTWFVHLGFNRWLQNLGKNLKEVFTYNQWHRLSHDLKFPLQAQPTDLTFNQWLGIFKFYLVAKNLAM